MIIYMRSEWSYQLSTGVRLWFSWKGKWCAKQGLVMLGNKLHMFILHSAQICSIQSIHMGGTQYLICPHSLHFHVETAMKPIYGFLKKKIPLISSLFSYIHSSTSSQLIHTFFFWSVTHTNTSTCFFFLADVSMSSYFFEFCLPSCTVHF
jgi:hypothetical protein